MRRLERRVELTAPPVSEVWGGLELPPLGGAQSAQDDLEALQEPPPIDLPPARIFQSPDMDGPETEPE
jgi:hypothetical protein